MRITVTCLLILVSALLVFSSNVGVLFTASSPKESRSPQSLTIEKIEKEDRQSLISEQKITKNENKHEAWVFKSRYPVSYPLLKSHGVSLDTIDRVDRVFFQNKKINERIKVASEREKSNINLEYCVRGFYSACIKARAEFGVSYFEKKREYDEAWESHLNSFELPPEKGQDLINDAEKFFLISFSFCKMGDFFGCLLEDQLEFPEFKPLYADAFQFLSDLCSKGVAMGCVYEAKYREIHFGQASTAVDLLKLSCEQEPSACYYYADKVTRQPVEFEWAKNRSCFDGGHCLIFLKDQRSAGWNFSEQYLSRAVSQCLNSDYRHYYREARCIDLTNYLIKKERFQEARFIWQKRCQRGSTAHCLELAVAQMSANPVAANAWLGKFCSVAEEKYLPWQYDSKFYYYCVDGVPRADAASLILQLKNKKPI